MKTLGIQPVNLLAVAAICVASLSQIPVASASMTYESDMLYPAPGYMQGISDTGITSAADTLLYSYVGVSNALYGPDGVYLPASYVQEPISVGVYPYGVAQETPAGFYGENVCPAPESWVVRGNHTYGFSMIAPEVFYSFQYNE